MFAALANYWLSSESLLPLLLLEVAALIIHQIIPRQSIQISNFNPKLALSKAEANKAGLGKGRLGKLSWVESRDGRWMLLMLQISCSLLMPTRSEQSRVKPNLIKSYRINKLLGSTRLGQWPKSNRLVSILLAPNWLLSGESWKHSASNRKRSCICIVGQI